MFIKTECSIIMNYNEHYFDKTTLFADLMMRLWLSAAAGA